MLLLRTTLLSLAVFLCFFAISLPVNASWKILEISNKQLFIDLSKYPTALEAYKSWILEFSLIPTDTLSLKEVGSKLFFFIEENTSWTGILLAQVGEKSVEIPLSYSNNSPSSLEINSDFFSIRDSMYSLDLQQRDLSCESAATSDIISTILGKDISEDEIVGLLPKSIYYNKLPTAYSEWGREWGDPNQGFVGYIDSIGGVRASQATYTGYGVYEYPIAQVYKQYGLESHILNISSHTDVFSPQKHLSLILESLKKGYMIQLWGDWCTQESEDGELASSSFTQELSDAGKNAKNTCSSEERFRRLSWHYKDVEGKYQLHSWLSGQHAFILLWFQGSVENPTHIQVWDTDTGVHLYPTQEWMRKWAAMDYRSLIIIP